MRLYMPRLSVWNTPTRDGEQHQSPEQLDVDPPRERTRTRIAIDRCVFTEAVFLR